MVTSINNSMNSAPSAALAEKKGDVDKGTTRKTPGDPRGARPPREEEYEEVKKNKKETKADPKTEKVDNEKKDINKKR
nr:hypothetical protein [Cytophagales bacterium]